jgi:hypothetical protein
MPDNEVKFTSGGTGSKQPRLELIPYVALTRGAARFERGIVTRPDGTAWNALSPNFHDCPKDREMVLSRAAHTGVNPPTPHPPCPFTPHRVSRLRAGSLPAAPIPAL